MRIKTKVKVMSGVDQIPASEHGHTVCTATHPDKPNFSGHARGRKPHLMKTEDKTFCNMLVDQLAPKDRRFISTVSKGLCKSCLKAIGKK